MKKLVLLTAACACLIGMVSSVQAVPQTAGLTHLQAGAYPGYTLFSSLAYPQAFLVDNYGYLVHSWPTTFVTGNTHYILENGDLLRCADPGGNTVFIAGGDGGLVQQRDWDNNILWEFLYSNDDVRQHHDIAPMPNGNVLVVAWEYRTEAECIQAGRDPALLPDNELWPDHVIEIEPDGLGSAAIVWEWHAWDHMIQDFDNTKDNFGVVGDHPELIDINHITSGGDWLHINSIDYNSELDQIVLSVPRFNEFWIIDHSVTTAEAVGHTGGNHGMGGDILYRWGNPQTYDRGTVADQKLWWEHDVDWIDAGLPGAGNIMVFNNGRNRPEGNYSTMEEITTTVDGDGMYPQPGPGLPHGPAAQSWIHEPIPHVYSSGLSSTQRVANGNTVIAIGRAGVFFEIDDEENTLWNYINPVGAEGPINQGDPPSGNTAFRAERYGVDFLGFVGRDLTPGSTIEMYAPASVETPDARSFTLGAFPNPVRESTRIGFNLPSDELVSLEVFDTRGRSVNQIFEGSLRAGNHSYFWKPGELPAGVYHYVLQVGNEHASDKLLVVR